jgi:hypothetical protein
MKTSILNFKKLFLAIGLLFISLYSNSQDGKLSREEKKEAKREKELYSFQVVDSMLSNKRFILEADFLENKYGDRSPVMSNVNFILVDSLRAVLQTGSSSIYGSNGVGGATAEGTVSRLKITKNLKNLSFTLWFTVTSQIGIYDVAMTINADKQARATISGTTPGKLTYVGRVVDINNSSVFKGMNSI